MTTVTETETEFASTTQHPPKKKSDSSKKAKEMYKKVLEESPFIFGNDGPLMPVEDISWINMDLIKTGMEWYPKYLALYVATTVIAMITLAVSIKPISALIFRNDKPMKPDAYFRRFLGKLRGIEKFFTLLLDPEEARKVFYKTRKLHQLATVRMERVGDGKPLPEIICMEETQWMRDVATAIQKDVTQLEKDQPTFTVQLPPQIKENLSWETTFPFNQFGLVYFTAGFFGIVWKKPKLFGMTGRDDIKMKALIHIWAVIAKLLGLRDEFNIFIHPDPDVIDNIANMVYVDSVKKVDTTIIYLQSMVVTGVNQYFPFLSVPACFGLTLQALGCETIDNLWKVMSIKDKFLFGLIKAVFWLSATVSLFRHVTNWMLETYVHWLYTKVLDKPNDLEQYSKTKLF